jgi:CheY-like chemotaxis protein
MTARILIVEDNAANLELVEYLLKAGGHRTLAATDGAEGVRMAREQLPDLVICDLQMPVLNGYEALQQLRGDPALRAIPVIAVTAFSMPGDREKVVQAGFDGYLTKPIDPETFLQQIEKHIRPA